MTPDEYFNDHIPHRVNLLRAFRERYSGRYPKLTLSQESYRDLFRCAKDMSFLMVRFFCEEMGITLQRGKSHISETKQQRWKQDISGASFGISKLSKAAIRADSRYLLLLEVLRAANRAVAHIEPVDVDHAFRLDSDHVRIFTVIDWMEDLIKSNIYRAAGRDYKASMNLRNNVMYPKNSGI